jgi:hypothetical protein
VTCAVAYGPFDGGAAVTADRHKSAARSFMALA